MTTLFYLLGYLGVLGFAATAFLKIRKYIKQTPMHARWELYPIPHETNNHGGSYMEEDEWWNHEHKVNHLGDLKALLLEVLFLESTFHHNRKLWVRTYPFHLGLYMLMGGAIILFLVAFLRVFGMSVDGGFLTLVGKLVNLMSLVGMLGIIGGGIGLIMRRLSDQGLRNFSTNEHFFDLGIFVLFGLTGLATWVTNPSFFVLSSDLVYNMLTFKWVALASGGFGMHMLIGFFLMVWIPLTFMSHLLLKYFFYHDIRWEDKATAQSEKNQKLIPEMLKCRVTWAAPHMNPNQESKTWLDIATSGYPVQDDAKK